MQLKVGDVLRWDSFPYPKEGDIKARWFIYLGRSTVLLTPIFAYLCTTTTQLEHFEKGGKRSNHTCKRFDCRQFSMFERDCILDYDEDLHTVTMEIISQCESQIQIKSRLDENTMRNIYKQYSRPGVVSPAVMRDIHESFNLDGITGLKKP